MRARIQNCLTYAKDSGQPRFHLLLSAGFLSCALEVSLIFIGWSVQPRLAYIITSEEVPGTRGRIIFVQRLCSTMSASLYAILRIISVLPKRFHRFCPVYTGQKWRCLPCPREAQYMKFVQWNISFRFIF